MKLSPQLKEQAASPQSERAVGKTIGDETLAREFTTATEKLIDLGSKDCNNVTAILAAWS